MDFDAIPKEAYALIGTIVGGLIGVLSTHVAQRSLFKIERIKIREARVGQVASDLAAVAHTTCWLTWSAAHNYVDKKLIENYNNEIHLILPKIIGSHIALASVDEELGQITRDLVLLAHEVDEKIGRACILYDDDPKKGVQMLADLNAEARVLDEDIFSRLADGARKSGAQGLLRRLWALKSSASSASASSAG